MKTYALFGKPVNHSLSPLMHDSAFTHRGIRARCVAIEAPDAATVLGVIAERDLSGAAVTIPLKEAVMEILDDVSDDARSLGAVNTIVRREGRLRGDNTDWLGIDRTLRELMGSFEGRTVLVLGGGGTARAALHALRRGGAQAVVASRREEQAGELAAFFGCRAVPMENIGGLTADCFINTTPLGMMGALRDRSPLGRDVLRRFQWGMDAVYRPLTTRLVREARKAGCTAVGGLPMFVHQGAEQFRIWTGEEAPRDVMADVVRKCLEHEDS